MLDRLLSSWDVTSPAAQGAVEGCLAEVEDLLSYCNDVLSTGGPSTRLLCGPIPSTGSGTAPLCG